MKEGKRLNRRINRKVNREITEDEINKKKKIIKVGFFTIIIAIILLIIMMILNNFIVVGKNKKTNLIINNNNITSNLKKDVIIRDDIIYLSTEDIKNFFDPHIYYEQDIESIVTSYGKKIATIGFEKNEVKINGAKKEIDAKAIKENGNDYLPISEMKEVYDIEIENIEKTKVITMDSLKREQIKGIVSGNVSLKSSTRFLSKTIDKIKKGDDVIVVDKGKKFSKVRTKNGKVGYIKTKKIDTEFTVREELEEEKQIDGKVNLTWDYFSEYASAPDRRGTKINGVNVVSPAFLYIDDKGNLRENIGDDGKEYIKWAHDNGYKVWPMVSNTEVSSKDLKITSSIMNSYEKRNKLIEGILEKSIKYGFDGINIDFENMYKKDKDMFSRFIIELTPVMKEAGLVVSVDVTAPDGGDTWSLCYDREVIGDVADYIVFMAYDQHGNSSLKAGTVAGYDWVKLNLNKFMKHYDINPEKIILGVPFYTRVWTTNDDYDVIGKKIVSIKNMDKVIPENAEIKWDDKLKQNYLKYKDGDNIKEIWIEDEKSLRAKVSLVNEMNLAGVGSWKKDMETPNIWNMIEEELRKETK